MKGEFKTVHFECWSDWQWLFSLVECSFHLTFFPGRNESRGRDKEEMYSHCMKGEFKTVHFQVGLIDNGSSAQLYAGFTSFFLLVTASCMRGMSRKCTASGWRRFGLIDNGSSAQFYTVFTSLFLLVTASQAWETSRKCTASGWRRLGLIDNGSSAQFSTVFTSLFFLVTASHAQGTSRKYTASGWRRACREQAPTPTPPALATPPPSSTPAALATLAPCPQPFTMTCTSGSWRQMKAWMAMSGMSSTMSRYVFWVLLIYLPQC